MMVKRVWLRDCPTQSEHHKLVTDEIVPLVKELQEAGLIDRWYFIRGKERQPGQAAQTRLDLEPADSWDESQALAVLARHGVTSPFESAQPTDDAVGLGAPAAQAVQAVLTQVRKKEGGGHELDYDRNLVDLVHYVMNQYGLNNLAEGTWLCWQGYGWLYTAYQNQGLGPYPSPSN